MSLSNSRKAICRALSFRREIADFRCFLACWTFSSAKAGRRSTSAKTGSTVSTWSERVDMKAEPEVSPMLVSTVAPMFSSV